MTDGEPSVSRRRLLAAVGGGTAIATAGCMDVLGNDPEMRLRATPAEGTETDVRCTLDDAFVDAHPKLRTVLDRATDKASGSWATLGLSGDVGTQLGDDLNSHCNEQTRGLYRYHGQWYFVSLSFTDPELHEKYEHGHSHGDGHHTHGGDGNHTHGPNATPHEHADGA